MMPVVLVIIIAAAWIVILAPSFLKRRARAGDGISSISHFHHQLRVLEHSGPQPIVTPAYRLRSLDRSGQVLDPPRSGAVGAAPVLTVVGADRLPRPALAFLGADPVGASTEELASRRPLPGSYLADGDRLPGPRAGATGFPLPAGDSHGRHLARRRRRDTLGVLTLVFVGTGMIGFVPGAGAAWMVTLLSGVALVAYVALLVQMRRMAEERERKLHYLNPSAAGGVAAGGGVKVPLYMSGRYAHPSNQVVAAH